VRPRAGDAYSKQLLWRKDVRARYLMCSVTRFYQVQAYNIDLQSIRMGGCIYEVRR
jgi:hypothetical protein